MRKSADMLPTHQDRIALCIVSVNIWTCCSLFPLKYMWDSASIMAVLCLTRAQTVISLMTTEGRSVPQKASDKTLYNQLPSPVVAMGLKNGRKFG